MSWTQYFDVPKAQELYEKLLGRSAEEVLLEALCREKGILVMEDLPIELDEDIFGCPVIGSRIELSDGRIFTPELVGTIKDENCDSACDIYEWREEISKSCFK